MTERPASVKQQHPAGLMAINTPDQPVESPFDTLGEFIDYTTIMTTY